MVPATAAPLCQRAHSKWVDGGSHWQPVVAGGAGAGQQRGYLVQARENLTDQQMMAAAAAAASGGGGGDGYPPPRIAARCRPCWLPAGDYHHHKGSSANPIPGGAKVRKLQLGQNI